jgi:hypothetical protein
VIKKSLAHLTYEDRKISKPNCFVLTKLKIKNRIGPAHRRLRRGEKTWEGKKGRLPSCRGALLFVVGRAPPEAGRRRAAPEAGRRRRICSGNAVANTPPFRRLSSVGTSTPHPRHPTPCPYALPSNKGEQTPVFFDNKQQVLIV